MIWLTNTKKAASFVITSYSIHYTKLYDATVGSWILGIGVTLMFVNIIRGCIKGDPVGPNPWRNNFV